MQLPLYALATGQTIAAGVDVVDGRYLSIWSGGISGRLSFGAWEKVDDPALTPVLEVAAEAALRF
ncbi:hypothetical protein ACX0FC_19955, partial [Enterococcus faecium]